MDCCRPASAPDAGYATAAAMVFAVAFSLLSAAMVARSVMLLRLARADLARDQAAIGLDGAHLDAAARLIRGGPGGPFHWAMAGEGGLLDVLAEPEADKLAPRAWTSVPKAALTEFGVGDPAGLTARLADAEETDDVAGLDPAPLWRECAASLFSPFGEQTSYRPVAASEPDPASKTAAWRVGEVWRVRITSPSGWRDDRIVRFSGDARHPVAVVRRRLSRSDGGQGRCEEVLAAAG